MTRKIVTLMTFVTNGGGVGPGHTAIAVDSTVYTFEQISGGWFSSGSGWKILDFDDYLGDNEFRPVILSTLTTTCRPDPLVDNIKQSIKNDDDYIGSGVCSSLVARAIDASIASFYFKPPGAVVTPWAVYDHAWKKGIVEAENVTWPGRGGITVLNWAGCVNKLKADYPRAYGKTDVGR